VVNFYSNIIHDTADWDVLAFNVVIFDLSDSSELKIFEPCFHFILPL
jgi:hypothetical protein